MPKGEAEKMYMKRRFYGGRPFLLKGFSRECPLLSAGQSANIHPIPREILLQMDIQISSKREMISSRFCCGQRLYVVYMKYVFSGAKLSQHRDTNQVNLAHRLAQDRPYSRLTQMECKLKFFYLFGYLVS